MQLRMNRQQHKMKKILGILLLLSAILFAKVKLTNNDHEKVLDERYNQAEVEEGFAFTFGPLPEESMTSAGVYKDGVLIRTLWRLIKYSAGTHDTLWDGKDDIGNVLPASDYQIKVQWGNVKATWNPPIGNNSFNSTGETVFRAPKSIEGMAFINNNMFIATGGSEGNPSHERAIADNPNATKSIIKIGGVINTSLASRFVATDGTRIYWAGSDGWSQSYGEGGVQYAQSMVFATDTNNNQIPFEQGITKKLGLGYTYSSVIDLTAVTVTGFTKEQKASAQETVKITGLAVNNQFLFVSRSKQNAIHVLNKLTGQLINTLTIDKPRGLATDAAGNLWVISGTNNLDKFAIKTDGSLGQSLLSVSGNTDPIAIAVSPDNSTLLICEGGNQQIIRAVNTSTGAQLWTLGEPGGYSTSSEVSNNKFYWKDLKTDYATFIAFAPDGSFWVSDAGCARTQHYAADRSYLGNIMQMGHVYCTGLDKNDSSRLFLNFLEFKMDYTKEIKPDNGSWKLVRNWGYNVALDEKSNYQQLRNVVTLKNGKTYALTQKAGGGKKVVELVKNGNLRFTGINVSNSSFMQSDGKMYELLAAVAPQKLTAQNLTGFKGDDPVWDATKNEIYSIPLDNAAPIYRGNPNKLFAGEVSDAGIYATATTEASPGSYYHLGGIKNGKFIWKADPPTFKEYTGNFPVGYFDIGHKVTYAGVWPMVAKNYIVRWYHGEFWQMNGQPQVNKGDFYLDSTGLIFLQCGKTRAETPGYAAFEMAGNAFCPSVTMVGDKMVVFNGDEDHHGGGQCWYITNLNSLHVQTINKTALVSAKRTKPYINLHAGLVPLTTLKNESFGWTRYPEDEESTFTVKLGYKSYDRLSSTDVFATFSNSSSNATNYVRRDLGNTTASSSWTISGEINLAGFQNLAESGSYFEVLDNAGKTLIRINDSTDKYSGNQPQAWVLGNGKTIVSAPRDSLVYKIRCSVPFTVAVKAGKATFKYGDWPQITVPVLSGVWTKPQTVQMRFTAGKDGAMLPRSMGVDKLKFMAN